MKQNLIEKLIIFSLFSITLIIKSQTPVELSVCDKKYALEMEKAVAELRESMNENDLKVAKEYMIMLKQRNDLENKINELESNLFDTGTLYKLKRPLELFQRCNLQR